MPYNNFFKELKRRNVYRVAITYAVVAWLLAQVVSLACSTFNAPDWVMQMIFVILIIGFPIALILAWAFEMSPQGIIRTTSAEAEENPYSDSRKPPLASNLIIGFLLLLIAGQFVYNRYWNNEGIDPTYMEKSIAVLPFKNESSNQENQYFCNGIMEGILDHLAKISDLTVISRTSVEQYREIPTSLKKIAEDLGVQFLVEGSVQRIDDQAIIFAQLIYAKSDKHLWSKRYNRNLEDVFAIQAEITQSIAHELQAIVAPDVNERIITAPTTDLTAYNHYLQAKYQLNKQNQEGFDQAIELLKKAILLDPNFAEAYSLLAISYGLTGGVVPNKVRIERQKEQLSAVLKALELDPSLIEANLVLGNIKYYRDWDFVESEKLFLKAQGKGQYPQTPPYGCYCAHTQYLINQGRFEEALNFLTALGEVDPYWVMSHGLPGLTYFHLGEWQKAEQYFVEGLESDQHPYLHSFYGWVLLYQGRYHEAIEHLQKNIELIGFNYPPNLVRIAIAHYKLGDQAKSKKLISEIKDKSVESIGTENYSLALYYSAIEDYDTALDYLERSLEKHEEEVLWAKIEPHFKPLSDNPRFTDVIKKIGL